MPNLPVSISRKASTTLVKQAKLFAQLPAEILEKIQLDFQVIEWRKGEYINSNILAKQFFVLLDGQVEFKQVNAQNAREATLDMYYAGDSFDIMVLLDGQPHDVIISPFNTVRLLSVPIDIMRHWIWTYPEVNNQFLPYLAKKMREKEEQATNLALHDITTRLSRVILKNINKVKTYTGDKESEHCQHLVNGLNDETLARMVGSVRQVVNKQLSHWKAQGILDKKRNQLIIKDLEALKQEAHYVDTVANNRILAP